MYRSVSSAHSHAKLCENSTRQTLIISNEYYKLVNELIAKQWINIIKIGGEREEIIMPRNTVAVVSVHGYWCCRRIVYYILKLCQNNYHNMCIDLFNCVLLSHIFRSIDDLCKLIFAFLLFFWSRLQRFGRFLLHQKSLNHCQFKDKFR